MIDRLVSFALSQRFIVIVAMLSLAAWGVVSFRNLPIDAYPDLVPPRVQIVTQWPGHAAEEVERQITIPLEVEMNGIPKLDALRSISLYGLSSITMNFLFDTDPYFAREQAFERISDAEMPPGVAPGISPLKLIGALLDAMELIDNGRLAVLEMDEGMLNACGCTHNDTEGVINLPLTAREIQAVVFFKTGPNGDVRVSMRSKYDVDVRSVASTYGGGGHKNAAGFTVAGSLPEVRPQIIERLVGAISEGLKSRP